MFMAYIRKKSNKDAFYKKMLKFIESRGKVVTTSEISEGFGISWNTAEKYLLELVIDAKITRLKKGGVNLWVLV